MAEVLAHLRTGSEKVPEDASVEKDKDVGAIKDRSRFDLDLSRGSQQFNRVLVVLEVLEATPGASGLAICYFLVLIDQDGLGFLKQKGVDLLANLEWEFFEVTQT